MIVGSPKEIFKGEARVAMTPESAKQIQKLGYTCILETGAGLQSNFSDKDYRDAGVKIVKTATQLWKDSDIILKVQVQKNQKFQKLNLINTLLVLYGPDKINPYLTRSAKRK